jgi:hypothetical protein
MAIPSLIASIGTLFVIRTAAARFIDPRTAHVPVLLFGLTPIAVLNASVALPDPIATLLGWCGFLLCAGPLLRADAKCPWLCCFAGGVLVAIGYNAKESIAVIVPGCMLFALANLLSGRTTAGLWTLLRSGVCALGAVSWAHDVAGMPCDPSLWGYAIYCSDYIRWLLDPTCELFPTGPVLLAGMIFALRNRTPFAMLVLCIVGPAFLYLSAGGSRWFPYHPLDHQTRYLLPFLPGMALLGGAMYAHLVAGGHSLALRTGLRIGLVAMTLAALIIPDRWAGRWYQADTYAACLEVGQRYFPLPRTDSRVCASQLTANRFIEIDRWSALPPIEIIRDAPATPAEWRSRYGGAYLIITEIDRRQPHKAKHAAATLWGGPLAALPQPVQIGRCEPPHSRLASLWAGLCGQAPPPSSPLRAVELWLVPE